MTTAVLSELEAKVAQHCDTVTWATTGIFVLSIFLSILRPDPTLTICLFGFYGELRKLLPGGSAAADWFFVGAFTLQVLMYAPRAPSERSGSSC